MRSMKSRGASILTVAALLSGPAVHAQEFLGVPYDKWLHFETSALLSVSVTQFERSWKWEDPFHLLPLGLVIAANAAKETYDVTQPGGAWDFQDVGTGALGGLFGIGLSNAWTASPRRRRTGHRSWPGLLSLVIPAGAFYNGTPVKGGRTWASKPEPLPREFNQRRDLLRVAGLVRMPQTRGFWMPYFPPPLHPPP